jgi:hypothetical protein
MREKVYSAVLTAGDGHGGFHFGVREEAKPWNPTFRRYWIDEQWRCRERGQQCDPHVNSPFGSIQPGYIMSEQDS